MSFFKSLFNQITQCSKDEDLDNQILKKLKNPTNVDNNVKMLVELIAHNKARIIDDTFMTNVNLDSTKVDIFRKRVTNKPDLAIKVYEELCKIKNKSLFQNVWLNIIVLAASAYRTTKHRLQEMKCLTDASNYKATTPREHWLKVVAATLHPEKCDEKILRPYQEFIKTIKNYEIPKNKLDSLNKNVNEPLTTDDTLFTKKFLQLAKELVEEAEKTMEFKKHQISNTFSK